MRLRDFVKDDELRQPTMLDANGEECFIVVKNGNSTGVTVVCPESNRESVFTTSMALIQRLWRLSYFPTARGWCFLGSWGLWVCHQ